MKHYLINVTWACNLHCSYCWVEQTVRGRPDQFRAKVRPMEDWARAINRDRVELVDIAGGEPFLMEWLPDLFGQCPGTRFGLSTNGLRLDGLRRLAEVRPRNLISINVSYHPEAAVETPGYLTDYSETINLLRLAGLPCHVNIVAAPGNVEQSEHALRVLREAGVHVAISPYEHMETLVEQLPQGLQCDGGVSHLNIAPDGNAWPCLTTMRSPYWRETCLGNWLDGPVDVSRKPQPCHLNCVDFYVLPAEHEAGDMWGLKVRPCAS